MEYKGHAIYIIKSIHCDRIYIGSAVNFKNRKLSHLSSLRKNKHCNYKLQRHFNKHSELDLIFEILEYVKEKNNLINREQFYIDKLTPYFNICPIAGSPFGKVNYKSNIEVKLEIIIENEKIIAEFKDIRLVIDNILKNVAI